MFFLIQFLLPASHHILPPQIVNVTMLGHLQIKCWDVVTGRMLIIVSPARIIAKNANVQAAHIILVSWVWPYSDHTYFSWLSIRGDMGSHSCFDTPFSASAFFLPHMTRSNWGKATPANGSSRPYEIWRFHIADKLLWFHASKLDMQHQRLVNRLRSRIGLFTKLKEAFLTALVSVLWQWGSTLSKGWLSRF